MHFYSIFTVRAFWTKADKDLPQSAGMTVLTGVGLFNNQSPVLQDNGIWALVW